MTITVVNIVAGPFVATGADMVCPFAFKVFTAGEVEVVYGTDRTVVDPSLYTVQMNKAIDGQAMEGGSVTLDAEALTVGQEFRVVAKPAKTQELVFSDTGSRLRNLNEVADRATLRALRARYEGALEGAGQQLIDLARDAGTEAGEIAGLAAGAAAAANKVDKGFDLIPNALSIVGSFALKSLGTDEPPPEGVYFGQGGIGLSFNTLISDPAHVTTNGDDQRAQMLLRAITRDDGNSEEQTLCILTTICTGYSTPYGNNKSFVSGENTTNFADNSVYRCIQGGVTAASGPGPTGQGQAIADGTVVWMWINDSAINAKLANYTEVVIAPGAGSAWAQVNNMDIEAGVLSTFLCNTEFDLTNHSGIDSTTSNGFNKLGVWIAVQGPNRSTTGLQISSANTANDASIWGAYFAGARLATNSVIQIDASSEVGLGFGVVAGGVASTAFTEAVIKDGSTSPSAIVLAGAYGNGINITGACSGAGIEITGAAPAAVVSGGVKTLAAFFDVSTAPYALRMNGTYSASPVQSSLFPAYADDAAAATAGLVVGAWYRTGSTLKQRAT